MFFDKRVRSFMRWFPEDGRGSVAEWSVCRTGSPAVPGSCPALTTTWTCLSVVQSSNPWPSLLIADWFGSGQLGILNSVMLSFNYLFQLFARPL